MTASRCTGYPEGLTLGLNLPRVALTLQQQRGSSEGRGGVGWGSVGRAFSRCDQSSRGRLPFAVCLSVDQHVHVSLFGATLWSRLSRYLLEVGSQAGGPQKAVCREVYGVRCAERYTVTARAHAPSRRRATLWTTARVS